MSPMRIGSVDVYDTTAELDPSDPTGQFAIVLNPLTLYVYTSSGYQVVGSGTNPPAPTPASETGQGVVELATQAEVEAGTAGILVATVARLKAELDRRVPVASETAQGLIELATTAEAQAGTLTGAYAMNPARTKEAITQQALTLGAWIAPTLLNSWVNYGAPIQTAGYRKTPTSEVQVRGMIKNGATAAGTTIFNLPSGYRPASERQFGSFAGGNELVRIAVHADGDVKIHGVTNNAFLSLESVRFDV